MAIIDSLEKQLQTADVSQHDTVIVHSSLKRIGAEGDAVLDALMDYFSQGLLVLPTLTYTLYHDYNPSSEDCRRCLESHPDGYCLARQWQGKTPEFHVNSTESCIGVLPNLFRVRAGVVRSLNPSHSVAAIGNSATEFVSGHEMSKTPCGLLSPWRKLYERNAKILHLGSPLTATTFMHGVCEWMHPEMMTPPIPNPVTVFDAQERIVSMPPQHITAGGADLLPSFENELEAKGILERFTFGNAPSIILKCRPLADFFFAH